MRTKITFGRFVALGAFDSFAEGRAAWTGVCATAHTRKPTVHKILLEIMGVVDELGYTLRKARADFELKFPRPDGRHSWMFNARDRTEPTVCRNLCEVASRAPAGGIRLAQTRFGGDPRQAIPSSARRDVPQLHTRNGFTSDHRT